MIVQSLQESIRGATYLPKPSYQTLLMVFVTHGVIQPRFKKEPISLQTLARVKKLPGGSPPFGFLGREGRFKSEGWGVAPGEFLTLAQTSQSEGRFFLTLKH